MSVYVDELRPTARSQQWPFASACHLVADSDEELHAFAERLGLRRAWHQRSGGDVSHYDLTAGKRLQAVGYGAIELTGRQLFEKVIWPARERQRQSRN